MPEAVQDPPTDDKTEDAPKEHLTKMSFGDHLDELRRRLVICMATLFVCVGVMMPFKDSVTSVYTGPYRFMWEHAYVDFLAQLNTEFDAGVGDKDPYVRFEHASFLSPRNVEKILRGAYPTPAEVHTNSGFGKPMPTPEDPGWPGWKREFEEYAPKLRDQFELLDQYIWNLERKEAIFAGKYEDNRKASLIFTRGGFALKKSLIAMGGLADFWTFMAAALLFACIAASPVLLWQAWAFIAAGLYKTERKVVHRAIPFAILLLSAGVAFGYFIMVPYGLYFLTRLMDWAQVTPMFSVTNYFKFFLTLTVALGMVFQLPLLMLALHKVGILKLKMMTTHWRWVVLSFFLVSAMLTPPDPITQALMVTPMLTLFGLGLFMMWRADKKAMKAGAGTEAGAGTDAGTDAEDPPGTPA